MANIFSRSVLVAGLWAAGFSALAQPEQAHWLFGYHAGLRFDLGAPVVVTPASACESNEADSVASDSVGSLLCYTDGDQVWDRTHAPMPNGSIGNRYSVRSAMQGALLVRQPGTRRYYLFTVGPCENHLAAGLRYSLVDMRLRNGLGDVVAGQKNLPLAPGQRMTEKLTAVRHANGRDYWILVHGWLSNEFYGFLLTPAGLSPVPVVSASGQRHQGGFLAGDSTFNASGYLRASPNGRWLAAAAFELALEIFAFDPATGRVSGSRQIATPLRQCYGVEFSPDNSKLYVSGTMGAYDTLVQVDLAKADLALALPIASVGAVGQSRKLLTFSLFNTFTKWT